MQHMEILLVILFISRKKIHAKQIVVLGSSTKLGPGVSSLKGQGHFHFALGTSIGTS